MAFVVWASCGLGQDDPVYDAFDALAAALRSHDGALIVFTYGPPHERTRSYEAVPISLLLTDARRAVPEGAERVESRLDVGLLAKLNEVWGGPAAASAENDVAAVCAAWERFAELTAPSVILSWSTTPPLSELHRQIALRRRVAWWSLERGPFPETLDLSFGQSSQVALANAVSMLRSEREADYIDRRFAEIRQYYHSSGTTHYGGSHRPVSADRAAYLLSGRGPRILFLGSYDVASGIKLSHGHEPALGERCSPLARTSAEAAGAVLASLDRLGVEATLWIRPHPAEPFALRALEDSRVDVMAAPSEELSWLFEHCDLIVSTLTTTQVAALLWEKPQIVLALGHLNGRAAVREAFSAQDLEAALSAFFAGEMATGWERSAREAVVLLFDRQLIGVGERAPTVLKIADLATLVRRFARYAHVEGATIARSTRWAIETLSPG